MRTRAAGLCVLALALAAFFGGGAAVARADAPAGFTSVNAGFAIPAGSPTGTIHLATTSQFPITNAVAINWHDGRGVTSGFMPDYPQCLFSDCDIYARNPGFPGPGQTSATIAYSSLLGTYTADVPITVLQPDFTLVSVGDSVASGEGNPDVDLTMLDGLNQNAALWTDGFGTSLGSAGASDCHQSVLNAGPAMATGLIHRDTGAIVRFDTRACTGNNVDDVVNQVLSLPPGHIDALTVSAGANSLGGGFDKVVKACLLSAAGVTCDMPGACLDPNDQLSGNCELLHPRVESDLADLPGKYDRLAAAIAAHPGGIDAVYITEYFDPSHAVDGVSYSGDCMPSGFNWAMTAAEWQWAHDHVMVPLNHAVEAAAAKHGWNFVGGIQDAFAQHGFCGWKSDPPQNWVVAATSGFPYLQSIAVQGDDMGTLHPNHAGQMEYARRIASAVGHSQPPHTVATGTPDDPNVANYVFGTKSRFAVRVSFAATAGLPTAGVGTTYVGVDVPDCTPYDVQANLGPAGCQTLLTTDAQRSQGIVVDTPGTHTISYFSRTADGSGYEQLQRVTVTIDPSPDTSADSTTAFGTWTRDDVSVKLSVDGDSSGVTIYYSVDDDTCTAASTAACRVYDGSAFTVDTEGAHVLRWFGVRGGFAEDVHKEEIDIDRTPPVATIAAAPEANASGWNSGPVTLVLHCDDALSGALVGKKPLSTVLAGDGANQTWSAECVDVAGNTSVQTASVSIDSTPPTASLETRTPANDAGWNNTPVEVVWGCDDSLSGPTTPTVAASVDTEGRDQQASASCTDLAGNVAHASEGAIDIDLTPPAVAGTPDRGGAWYTAPFSVDWTGTDALSQISSCDAPSTYSGPDIALGSLVGKCVDAAGNVGSASFAFHYDATAPTIALTSRTPANTAGWNNTPVDVVWSCADLTSGPVAPSVSVHLGTEGDAQSASATCADVAGNTASATVDAVRIDLTPPTTSVAASRGPDVNGWYNHALGLTWSGIDALSGVASCTGALDYAGPDTAAGNVTGSCIDAAGNEAPASLPFRYDATAPAITFSGNQGVYAVTDTVSISCVATDAVSGPVSAPCAGISGPAWSFATGVNAFTATAADAAGNTGTARGTFAVAVTPAALCDLTRSFAGASVPNRIATACNKLAAVSGAKNAGQRRGQVQAFTADVTSLVSDGYLTRDQAATLLRLADAL